MRVPYAGHVEHDEAVSLIRSAAPQPAGTWADLGAGSGVFTRALAELLGAGGMVYAVDRKPRSIAAAPGAAPTEVIQADFTEPLPFTELDGVLMANALHFVRRQARVLAGIVATLKSGGRFILVEYDLERGTPWIPFPVPPRRFAELAEEVG